MAQKRAVGSALLVLTSCSERASAPVVWETSVVARDWLPYGQPALMVGQGGTPHIAYNVQQRGAGLLRHAWLTLNEFKSEQVDQYDRGLRKAWVLGSSEPRLVYDDLSYRVVNFHAVRGADSAWNVHINEVSESAAATAAWWDDRFLLAYVTAARGVEVPGYEPLSLFRQGIVFNGQSLPIEATKITAEPISAELAFQLDKRGTAHIVYTAPDDNFEAYLPVGESLVPYTVRYVTVNGGVWSEPEALSTATGYYAGLSLGVDEQDTAHVAFSEVGSFPSPEDSLVLSFGMTYLRRDFGAGSWVREAVPAPEAALLSRNSLAVDPSGDVDLVYCRVGRKQASCDGVSHARRHEGVWSTEEIGPSCTLGGTHAAIARGSDGGLHAVYQGCEGELVYARRPAVAVPL